MRLYDGWVTCCLTLSVVVGCNARLLSTPEPNPINPLFLKTHGFSVIKGYKVCGSTFVGAMWRMAFRHNINVHDAGQVPRRMAPKRPDAYHITIVRDPGERCLSEMYYAHMHDPTWNGTVSDEGKIAKLSENCDSHFQTKFLAPETGLKPLQVFNEYRFVATCERFDESLLLMGKLFNFTMVDMLYMKSKENGHMEDRGFPIPPHVPLSQETPRVKKASEVVYRGDDGNLLALANTALRKASQRYGLAELTSDLQHFRTMLDKVEEKCRPYFKDGCLRSAEASLMGANPVNDCGQSCIDNVVMAEGLTSGGSKVLY